MSQKSGTPRMSSERIVKDIRRATRKQYSAEEKIRIVLDGLRGEHSIAELCRREGISSADLSVLSMCYKFQLLKISLSGAVLVAHPNSAAATPPDPCIWDW